MRESKIERAYCRDVEDNGGLAFKLTSPPNPVGVVDRFFLAFVRPEHRTIVARYVWFVEFKAPGKKPGSHQKRRHADLTERGYRVEVIDG